MDSKLHLDSSSLPVGNHLTAVQPIKRTGKTKMPLDLDEIKVDEETPVCFELMGMGDLEVVDVVDAGLHMARASDRASGRASAGPYAAWGPDQAEGPPQSTSFMSFCSADWVPSEDSSDAEDFMKARILECCVPEGSGCTEDTDGPTTSASAVRSKLSMARVTQVNILPDQPSTSGTQGTRQAHTQVHLEELEAEQTRRRVHRGVDHGEVVDVEVDVLSEDEDEVSRGAPTPDNTPEHSPSEEHQPGGLLLGLESGSALYSTLKGMALSGESRDGDLTDFGSSTPSPACSPETSPGVTPGGTLAATATTASGSSGSALGRVWSLILGRSGKTQGSPTAALPPHSDSDDDDSGDDDALYVDPQTIEELEATLEEVRLDGDGDDPVVSYLVEEAEDAARSPGAASRDVTVEEVHEDEGTEHPDGAQHLGDVEGPDGLEVEVGESKTTPAPKASGLLSRIFSRSKTSQDITKVEVEQPVRRTERGAAVKRAGKGEVSNSDRLLHLHRMKPRQPNKAMRGSLSRILGRLLRQGKNGPWGVGPVGAEGDTGDTGVSPPLSLRTTGMPTRRSTLQQPPALQCTRRATTHTLPQSALTDRSKEISHSKFIEDECLVGEKLSADFASQTDESHLSISASQQSQMDSQSVGLVLNKKENILTDDLGLI